MIVKKNIKKFVGFLVIALMIFTSGSIAHANDSDEQSDNNDIEVDFILPFRLWQT